MNKCVCIVLLLLTFVSLAKGQRSFFEPLADDKLDSLLSIVRANIDKPHESPEAFYEAMKILGANSDSHELAYYGNKILRSRDKISDKFLISEVFNLVGMYHNVRDQVDSLKQTAIAHNLFLDSLSSSSINKYQLIEGRVMALRNLALSYEKVSDINNSLKYFLEAKALIENIDIKEANELVPGFRYHYVYLALFDYYNIKKSYIEAFSALKDFRVLAESIDDVENLARIDFMEIRALSKTESGNPALLIQKLMAMEVDNLEYAIDVVEYYVLLSSVYRRKGVYDSAKKYANKATVEAMTNPSGSLSDIGNRYLYNAYLGRDFDDWKWAFANLEYLAAVRLTKTHNTSATQLGVLENQLEFERNEYSLRQEIKAKQDFTIVVITGSIILLVINIILFRMFRISKKFKKLKDVEVEKLTVANELAQVKKERLEQILDYKRRQLTTTTLLTNKLNAQMSGFHEKLNEIKQNIADAPRLLERLVRDLNSNMKLQDDWSQFYKHFESVHPDFFNKLHKINESLTNHELRHAAYVVMNLSNKEVASMLNITPNSAKTARVRLKKRLNIATEDSLQTFINNLVSGPDTILMQA